MGQGKTYKPTDLDRDFVERSVQAGSYIEIIAECLGITDDTLRKYYKFEIITARERLKGSAIRVLNDSLADNNLDAAKFVLARVAKWTETSKTELTGKDGGAVKVEDVKTGIDKINEAIDGINERSGASSKTE